jgi:hypothetical protein
MAFKVGKPKSLDDITGQDIEAHPIWLWVWEVGLEEEADDETWQCPVLGSYDVTADMAEPMIALRTKTGAICSASYDPETDALKAIALWQGDTWIGLERSGVPTPISFIAIPTIRGVSSVEFICRDLSSDMATRVG